VTPRTFTLTPADVCEAVADWLTRKHFAYMQERKTVYLTVAWFPDGSVTAIVSDPVPNLGPKVEPSS
jgi:hypothetical protein